MEITAGIDSIYNKMTSERLKDICIIRFGSDAASRLVPAMEDIKRLDFCVATAFNETELSISRGCIYQGKIFKLTDDCRGIYLPGNGSPNLIRNLTHPSISKYLEYKRFNPSLGKTHCFMDNLARYQGQPKEL